MGLFNIFTGKSPADYERTGDALARDKVWGEAKLAFEAALDKLEKQSPADPAMSTRLRNKLQRSKEALAMVQRQDALELIDAGCMEEARELLGLAIELTADPQFKEALTQQIHKTTLLDRPAIQDHLAGYHAPPDEPEADIIIEDADEHFDILLGALPDEIQQAYRSYGHHFKLGYLALNQGEFDQAVTLLTQAVEENRSPQSLVPLELATAYVNLGQASSAKALLEELIRHLPDLLPAFQLLCEIYWEDKDFDQAMQLLETLAPELAQSMGAYVLKGETFLKAGRNDEAQSFFHDLIENYGWNETIALGLAKAYEALGQTTRARDVYGDILAQCSGCGTWIDPSIKRKFADLSFASGQYTTKVLEYYLALSQEDPDNAVQYFNNISRIYLALGNQSESKRFQSIANELVRRQNMTK
jgi:tetratricopeptide (TPR) repeat protein